MDDIYILSHVNLTSSCRYCLNTRNVAMLWIDCSTPGWGSLSFEAFEICKAWSYDRAHKFSRAGQTTPRRIARIRKSAQKQITIMTIFEDKPLTDETVLSASRRLYERKQNPSLMASLTFIATLPSEIRDRWPRQRRGLQCHMTSWKSVSKNPCT